MKFTNVTNKLSEILSENFSEIPIIVDYIKYYSNFNVSNVLLVTDEKLENDLRVIHQIYALSMLTDNITVIEVVPKNDYGDSEKSKINHILNRMLFHNLWLLPKFVYITNKFNTKLPIRLKAKQGIYNDHSHFINRKIDTSKFSLVITNNLISVNAVEFNTNSSYVYDIHEFELFRNRVKQSLLRSFYIYIRERRIFKTDINLVTISKNNADILSDIYKLDKNKIECIYNRNFRKHAPDNSLAKLAQVLLIYIGAINMDRGLNDIVNLSKNYKVLVIGCTHNQDALDFLLDSCNCENLDVFLGMEYEDYLLDKINKYEFCYSLILINPRNPSYRNALPNKFFQAQAVGLPIIVYADTYLASIVKLYSCGLIYEAMDKFGEKGLNSKERYLIMQKAMQYDIEIAINHNIL